MFTHKMGQQIVDSGWFFILKDNDDGKKCLFTSKDKDGDLKFSGWWYEEKECFYYPGECGGYAERYFNKISKEDNWQFVRFVHPTELTGDKKFEEGQKVAILPNAKEECKKYHINWCDGKQKIVDDGFGYFNRYTGMNFRVYNKEKDNLWYFPQTCVAPWIEGLHEEEVEELTMDEVCKELGRTIKIKK